MKNILNIRQNSWRENLEILIYVSLLFITSRLLLVLVGCIFNYLTSDYTKTWDLLCHFDSEWYIDIIENGYQSIPRETGQANYAFYPLYPMTVKFLKHFFPADFTTNQIGILLSNFCIFIGAFVSVKWIRTLHSKENGYFFVFLLFFAPHSMYFAMTYTEAMFMMFCIIFFYAAQNKKFLIASICACFAALTRIVGVFLVFPLVIIMYQEVYGNLISIKNLIDFIKKTLLNPLRLFEILLCPLGIFSYLYFLYKLVGDVWASAHIEVAWHQSYHSVIKAIYNNLLTPGSGASSQYWALWAILSFFLIGYLVYKKYYAHALFGFLSLVVPFNTDLVAASRYVMGTVVIYLALYEFLKNKQTAKIVIMNTSIVVTAVLYYMWFSSNCFFVF